MVDCGFVPGPEVGNGEDGRAGDIVVEVSADLFSHPIVGRAIRGSQVGVLPDRPTRRNCPASPTGDGRGEELVIGLVALSVPLLDELSVSSVLAGRVSPDIDDQDSDQDHPDCGDDIK
jgi:hypothetical protein